MGESQGHAPARIRVSVLVVNYRAYDELDDCLRSLAQAREPLDIVVVDHASDAGQLARLQLRHREVRWVGCGDNPGFAAGVNRGSRHARGDYLYLLNPDAVVEPDTPTVLAYYLEAHPPVGVVGSRVLDADGAIQGSARGFPNWSTALAGRTTWLTRTLPGNPLTRRNVLTGDHVRQPTQVDWVSGASLMVRADAFREIAGMDERFFLYWEDADLCRRLRDRGWLTMYHPGASVTHLCGRSAGSSTRALVAFHRSAYLYFRKHATGLARLGAPLAYLALGTRLGVKLLAVRVAARSRGEHA
jgi:N-acetylglucosaminyl-diphospho-decaprenol L-rhamnosyltransferase